MAACDSGRSSGGASPTAGSSSEVSGWGETGTTSGDSRFPPDPGADVVGPGGLAVVVSEPLGVTGSAVDTGGSAEASAGAVSDADSGVAGINSAADVVAVVTGSGESVSPPSPAGAADDGAATGVATAVSVSGPGAPAPCVDSPVADGSTSPPGVAASGLVAPSTGGCNVRSAAAPGTSVADCAVVSAEAVVASVVPVELAADKARASPALCADSAVAFGSASTSFGAGSGCNPSSTGWRNVGSVAASGVDGTGSAVGGLGVCSASGDGAGSAGAGAAGTATTGAGSGASGSGTGGGTLTRAGRNATGSTYPWSCAVIRTPR